LYLSSLLTLPGVIPPTVASAFGEGVPTTFGEGVAATSVVSSTSSSNYVTSSARGSFDTLAYCPVVKLLPNIVAISWKCSIGWFKNGASPWCVYAMNREQVKRKAYRQTIHKKLNNSHQ
jgi:hypothetical protein